MFTKPEPKPQHNHLLAALSPEVQSRLFPYLELVPIKLREILNKSNISMPYVYFPTDSIVSLQYMLQDGKKSIAISAVGNEGLVGVTFIGIETTPRSRSLVQSPGFAYRLPKHLVEEEFKLKGQFMRLMLCYTQSILIQVTQTAICNRRHTVFQQLCRWLLISLDRLEHEHLTMTQEFISNMIGVRRESITVAATDLLKQGVITYHRGMIKVIDRQKLENLSCECYAVVKKDTDKLMYYVPQKNMIENIEAITTDTRDKLDTLITLKFIDTIITPPPYRSDKSDTPDTHKK